MLLRRSLFALLLTSAAACTLPDDQVALDNTESDLSASNWSTFNRWAGFSEHPTQVATLNGTTYMVMSGFDSTEMYWSKREPSGSWIYYRLIPGQRTKDRVSLAAFNGYLYMAHVGENDAAHVWLSRFDPATEAWTPNILLPYTTDAGPPALAAFDNRLFIVGIDSADNATYPMWVATMNRDELFTSAMGNPRQFSASRPSLAVFANKLYLAHRNGATGEIVYSTHNAGAAANAWSATSFIRAATLAAGIRGDDVSLAAVNGYLHLVHRRFDSALTYWTYFDQCKWAPEVSIDAFQSDQPLSLTTSSEGLLIVRTAADHRAGSHTLYTKTYTAPPAPMTLPQCLGSL